MATGNIVSLLILMLHEGCAVNFYFEPKSYKFYVFGGML
jgi:hypothetical protein